jgi:putative membrane protein
MSNRNGSTSIARGMIAGALGGLIAAWVMNGFIAAATTVQETMKSPEQKAQEEAQKAAQPPDQSEDSTMKVADAVAWLVTGEHLSREGKQKGGPIVHYAYGTLVGAMYGTLAELSGAVTAGAGTAFGTGLFIASDEVMVGALITGQFPTKEPAASQLTHYGAHLVYGATTELVRRIAA